MFVCRTRGDNNNQSECWGNWAADCFSSKPIFKSPASAARLIPQLSCLRIAWQAPIGFCHGAHTWPFPELYQGNNGIYILWHVHTWEGAEASKVRLSLKAAKISFTDRVFPSHSNCMPVSCRSVVSLLEVSYLKPSLTIKHYDYSMVRRPQVPKDRRPWSGDILH